MVGPLQALVRRQRLGQPYPRRLGELRGGLFAEEPEQVGSALQVTALGRVRRGEEPEHKTYHDRLDPGDLQGDPRCGAEQEVEQPEADSGEA